MPRRRDDDDDYDDRPRRKRRRDDDDEDDVHDPKRRHTGGGISPLMLAGGAVGVLLLIAGIVVLVVLMLDKGDDPAPAGENPPEVAGGPLNPRVPGRPDSGDNRPGDPRPAPAPTPTPQPRQPAGLPPESVLLQGVDTRFTQLVFAGGPQGYAGIVGYADLGPGHEIDVVNTTTGLSVGRVPVDTPSAKLFAVSPDGKWAAAARTHSSERDQVSIYDVSTGRVAKAFDPYPRGAAGGRSPQLEWVSFVAPNRLLTINEGGGFDVWAVPGGDRIGGHPPRTDVIYGRIDVNGFTHTPKNFALTPDGKTLALFNGTGFSFYDTATGRETARTPPYMKDKSAVNFFATAFSPDGAWLACFCHVHTPPKTEGILIWDVKTGKGQAVVRPQGVSSASGFAWWGAKHLLLWAGGISTADVLELKSGTVVAKVRFKGTGKVGTVPPDGRLWGVTRRTQFRPETDQVILSRHEAPDDILPGTKFEIHNTGEMSAEP